MDKWSAVPLVLAVSVLAGCSSMPTTGPTAGQIESARKSETLPEGLELVEVTPVITAKLEKRREPPLSGRFDNRRPSPRLVVGVGDTLAITIFEAATAGFFSPSAGQLGGGTKSATLPPQPIGPDGHITVPYAGRISVVGRSPDQIEQAIVAKLPDKAIEPQVVATVQSARSSLVTVDGEVGAAGRVPLSPKGDHLMDVIATAGGTKGRANDLFVRLTRGGNTGMVPLRTILEDPAQNIWAWPGDQVFVYREPQTFTAYGATGRSGTFPFEFGRMSLADALGVAAGLNDNRAEPAGVFLFRREAAAVVCDIKDEKPCAEPNVRRSVVYQINLRDPAGIALAQRVPIHNKDLVYVANAEGAELAKVLRLFAEMSSAANSLTSAETRIQNNW